MNRGFEEFLKLNTVQQVEQMLGVKLHWYQKLHIKYWIDMCKQNKYLTPSQLYESMRKGRY